MNAGRPAGLVECVPNFSEGRRREVVDALAQAIAGSAGVWLLDRTSDTDHNRSVLTFAGAADAVEAAMESATAVALQRIDMPTHTGQHPRIGAVDVVPFVPLGETTMEECVALAGRFGERVARRFGLPVYLYAEAASRPGRRVLADVRRPQFEGLAGLMATPGGEPDFGPRYPHPRGGATAVGARPFLIAFNVNLETEDVAVAKRVAARIRERGGGLARVQALGLYLEELRSAQVSMNLLDHAVTPLWRVWETVVELARSEGVGVRESELIGLAPLAALLEVAAHYRVDPAASEAERITRGARHLRIRGFDPSLALELRLAALTSAGTATKAVAPSAELGRNPPRPG